MYVTGLHLENFKRFPALDVDLDSKITLLLGPNSSGKSSIIKSLLALKQTASSSNEHEVLAPQGDYVDLGIYRDYVFEHKTDRKIKIGLSISSQSLPARFFQDQNQAYIEFQFGHDFATEQARLLEITVKSSASAKNPYITLIKKQTRDTFSLKLSEEAARATANDLFPRDDSIKSKAILLWTKGRSTRVDEKYKLAIDRVIQKNEKKFDFFADYPIHILSSILSLIFRELDSNIFYVGPLRRSPSRSYSRTAHLLAVGAAGEHTPSILANLKSRASKERSAKREQTTRYTQLARWIESMFSGRRVDSRSIEELVKLEIERERGEKEIISDVGFGFSQVLPILVQIAVMPENSTIVIEQPELHLHPSAQSKLAEIIVEATKTGRRFVVETHSEHLVRGLQLAISNKKLGRTAMAIGDTEVKFLYTPRAPGKPKEMRVNSVGDFEEPWPSGFFDEAYTTAMKLLDNKIALTSKAAHAKNSGDNS
ncbi:putative ATPase [Variovorax boronicumulans]|uniref:AAA family ATPase n=1 Tax=Variovorax boronicumulans TaxID=436515 RepID=UPI00277F5E51|nr:AAA family ATPase [Variovorax boronicumulans]MDQ0017673.1 putative ATPase [Variovorax boronicumulans]